MGECLGRDINLKESSPLVKRDSTISGRVEPADDTSEILFCHVVAVLPQKFLHTIG